MTWGWVNDYIYIFERTIPLRLVFPLGTVIAEGRTENISLYLHMPSLICFPWRDPLCFVTLGTVPRVVWCVGLSLCLSASLTLCSLQAHLSLWYGILSRFLSTWLSVIHPLPPHLLSSCSLSSSLLLWSTLTTHLSLEVVKQKMCLFEKLSIFSPPPPPISSAWLEEKDTAIMRSVP